MYAHELGHFHPGTSLQPLARQGGNILKYVLQQTAHIGNERLTCWRKAARSRAPPEQATSNLDAGACVRVI